MRTLSPRRTEQEWLDLNVECRKSGLPDIAWCQQQDIAPNTFYYHVKQLRERACGIPDSITDDTPNHIQEVVPIEIQALNVYESQRTASLANGHIDNVAIIVDYHGVNVKVVNNASSSAIYETLKALRELC